MLSWPNSRSQIFSPVFCCKSLLILYFTFMSIIHFVKFCEGVRCWSRLMFLYIDVQLFWYHLLKSLPFFYLIAFIPLSKISWSYMFLCFLLSWTLYFVLLIYLSSPCYHVVFIISSSCIFTSSRMTYNWNHTVYKIWVYLAHLEYWRPLKFTQVVGYSNLSFISIVQMYFIVWIY